MAEPMSVAMDRVILTLQRLGLARVTKEEARRAVDAILEEERLAVPDDVRIVVGGIHPPGMMDAHSERVDIEKHLNDLLAEGYNIACCAATTNMAVWTLIKRGAPEDRDLVWTDQ